MGRLMRWLAPAALAAGMLAIGAGPAAAFDGFGEPRTDSTYGDEVTFDIDLRGGAPEILELLIRTTGSDGAFVVSVEPSGASARYVWDTSVEYVTPNTLITYQWRATDDGTVARSAEEQYRYVDDRPGLDWQSAQLGEATVHWYGGAEAQARRFGELTAVGVERAERLFGSELAGPVDVFVYATHDAFFGALGPGVREWAGAAAYPPLRTIFMSLEGGAPEYLEVVMIHEVTHIVWNDATDNPFHEPARWLNEGLATWSETSDDSGERETVEAEADEAGLFAFEAITEQFPIGQRGGLLSYAQGTTMVDLIIDRYGTDAIARIAAAYRDGASDAEALEAGTGIPADDLYADYFAEFGVSAPTAIEPEPILPSNVDRPAVGHVDPGGVDPDLEPPPAEPAPGEETPPRGGSEPAVIIGLGLGLALAGTGAYVVARRAERRAA
jgi:hypothetical protein